MKYLFLAVMMMCVVGVGEDHLRNNSGSGGGSFSEQVEAAAKLSEELNGYGIQESAAIMLNLGNNTPDAKSFEKIEAGLGKVDPGNIDKVIKLLEDSGNQDFKVAIDTLKAKKLSGKELLDKLDAKTSAGKEGDEHETAKMILERRLNQLAKEKFPHLKGANQTQLRQDAYRAVYSDEYKELFAKLNVEQGAAGTQVLEKLAKFGVKDRDVNAALRGLEVKNFQGWAKSRDKALDDAFNTEVSSAVGFKKLFDKHGESFQAFQDARTGDKFLASVRGDKTYQDSVKDFMSIAGGSVDEKRKKLNALAEKHELTLVKSEDGRVSQFKYSGMSKNSELFFAKSNAEGNPDVTTLSQPLVAGGNQTPIAPLGQWQKGNNATFDKKLSYVSWSKDAKEASQVRELSFSSTSLPYQVAGANKTAAEGASSGPQQMILAHTPDGGYRLISTAEAPEKVVWENLTHQDALFGGGHPVRMEEGKVVFSDGTNDFWFLKQSDASYQVQYRPQRVTTQTQSYQPECST